MILSWSLGHPARWLDVCVAVDRLYDEALVKADVTMGFQMSPGEQPSAQIVVTLKPILFSPYADRRPIVKTRVWPLSGRRPLSEGIYAVLCDAELTRAIVWPIVSEDEGKGAARASDLAAE